MVSPNDFKENIKKHLSQEFSLEFLGDDFDKIVSFISDTQAEKIYSWITQILNKNIQPIVIGSKKQYKDWRVYELLFFRKELNISNTEYRIFFIKVKNSFYIEFHLGKHDYYDKLRKKLDLTKRNY